MPSCINCGALLPSNRCARLHARICKCKAKKLKTIKLIVEKETSFYKLTKNKHKNGQKYNLLELKSSSLRITRYRAKKSHTVSKAFIKFRKKLIQVLVHVNPQDDSLIIVPDELINDFSFELLFRLPRHCKTLASQKRLKKNDFAVRCVKRE